MGTAGAVPSADTAAWLRARFARPLRDLSELGYPELAGIYSPVYDAEEVKRYMSSHYENLDSARAQDASFNLNDYYLGLLREAIDRTGGGAEAQSTDSADSVRSVLEVGCGFGSATFPLLRMFPGATVVASEFSTAMLHVLKSKLTDPDHRARCVPLQLNAEEMDFAPESFDLVVGAAVLHHLFHPEKVIEGCARILKPGGRAIFFEPFENGLDIVALIYRDIMRDPRSLLLGPRAWLYFRNCVRYWGQMRSADKDGPFFVGADDKWLFTPSFFEALRKRLGFRALEVFALDKSPRPFEALIRTHLAGNNMRPLPAWGRKIVDRYEAAFSDAFKQSLFTEGGVVLQK